MAMAPEPIADKKGLAIILCNAMFGLIAVICVILRVYATYLRGAKFRLHDYLIFGGLVCRHTCIVKKEKLVPG